VFEANKIEKVYGRKYQMTETEAAEIIRDLKAHGKRKR
jgi:hypothetical protein